MPVGGTATVLLPGSSNAPTADLITGFQNGFVFELIDSRETSPLAVHVLVLNPDQYELTEPHQSTLTPTAANTVVDESNGIVQGTMSISGTFGVKERRATAFEGAQGGGSPLSGFEHFKDLRNMFRLYSKYKQDPLSSAYVSMIFHALRSDDHFVIAKPVFTTPRDAKSTRMHHRYRIQAATVGDASSISKLRRSKASSKANYFSDATRAVAEAFNDARAGFAEVNEGLGTVRRKIGNINAIMVNAAQFINAVGNAVSNASDTLIAYPLKLAATATEQVADAADFLAESIVDATEGTQADNARSLRRMETAMNRILAFPERFKGASSDVFKPYDGERNLTEQDITDRTAGATIGSRTRVRAGGEAIGNRFGVFASVEALRLTATDTLESLGSRFDVDPELIIVANDLRPPYILPGGGPGLLQPGDNILIPQRESLGGQPSAEPGSDYVTADESLYGVDFALDLDLLARESKLDFRDPVSADAGDLDYVGGFDNVVQGTTITVWTERGSTTFLSDVGINRNVGRKGTIQHVMLASLNLREAILADSRISGIQSSAIVLDNDVLTQEIVPIVTGRKDNTTIVLPFGSARGS